MERDGGPRYDPRPNVIRRGTTAACCRFARRSRSAHTASRRGCSWAKATASDGRIAPSSDERFLGERACRRAPRPDAKGPVRPDAWNHAIAQVRRDAAICLCSARPESPRAPSLRSARRRAAGIQMMLVGEQKKQDGVALLLDPAGRRSLISPFRSSRKYRMFVKAAVCVCPGAVPLSAIAGPSQASIRTPPSVGERWHVPPVARVRRRL